MAKDKENERIYNPYSPGFAVRPYYLAGRQEQVKVICDTLDAIKGGAGQMDHSPLPALAMIGPRGVGKTVLLGVANEEASKRGIHTASFYPRTLKQSQEGIVHEIFHSNALAKAIGRFEKVKLDHIQEGLEVGRKEVAGDLSLAMPAFLSKKPLLLLLDEAYNCTVDQINMLFETTHKCLSANLPLSVIIAGTPDTSPLLAKANQDFQKTTRHLRFNKVSESETRKGLEIPARETGRPITPEALKLLMGWAVRYVYFIQLVGDHAWGVSCDRGGKEINVEDAKKGMKEAQTQRDFLFDGRVWELFKSSLHDYALQSAKLIRGDKGKGITPADLAKHLMEKYDGLDKEGAEKAIEGLQNHGFIWLRDDGVFEAGIESLFDFALRRLRD